MPMRRFASTRWNFVEVEIERTRRGNDQVLHAGFLHRLALRDAEGVFVAIAVAADAASDLVYDGNATRRASHLRSPPVRCR